jgi:transposase InsO family protein
LDYICAERLTPALLPTARHLAQFGECQLTPQLEADLATISRATVQRLLRTRARPTPRLPRKGPEEANRLRQAVPMGRLPWQLDEPGHFEVDLVHHCGSSATGDYVHTIQMVDIATGWSERAAVLGRSQRAMEAGFRRILGRVPFPVVELHPDNGSEFFNDHLVRFWGEALAGLKLSRSRPYHKNDNGIVEQKNDTLVRAYLGHGRLDTAAQAQALDELYEQLWLYYNLFQPVLHLAEKVVTDNRLRRKWDTATTPYQRVVATGVVDEDWRATLDARYARTNPRQLRRTIYEQLGWLWAPPAPEALAAD